MVNEEINSIYPENPNEIPNPTWAIFLTEPTWELHGKDLAFLKHHKMCILEGL